MRKLELPYGVAVGSTGNLFIADTRKSRIRKVIFSGPALLLNNVGSGNAGAYDVVVFTQYGSVTSSVVNLTVMLPVVLSAPQIAVGRTNFTFQLSGSCWQQLYAGSFHEPRPTGVRFSTSTIPVSA